MSKQHSIIENPRRFVGIVEYDGTSYKGFQKQPEILTIQGEIERCLKNMLGSPVQITSAGRTDAGVHAYGQVISFSLEVNYSLEVIKRALNSRLPSDIQIKSLHETEIDFDPRRDAIKRSYRYILSNGASESVFDNRFSYYVNSPLNIEKMAEAMNLFIGEHDFRNFAGSGVDKNINTIRNIFNAYVVHHENKVELFFEANAFIRHQVRNMAGLILRVGLSYSTVNDVNRFIKIPLGNIRPPMLPAKGLYLEKVTYPDSVFVDNKLSQRQVVLASLMS